MSGDINSIATGDTSMEAWPFILCMEEADGNPSHAESCFSSSMNSTSVTYDDISKCVADEFETVTGAAKDATPSHDCKLYLH